jgi:4-aminobutyrate aminotransferase-like enzyme
VTLGKPMGDGHPLAGVVARRDFIDVFGRRSRYFNTFGGNPVSAAVGRAVLEVIRSEGLVENATRVGAYLGRGMKELQTDSPLVGDVRHTGLYMGVEIVSDRASKEPSPALAAALANTLRREGVLVGLCGKQSQCLKIRPPLPFSMDNADYFLEKMRVVLARVRPTAEAEIRSG